MEEWLLDNLIGEFFRVGLGKFVDLNNIKTTIKKILSLREYALEYKINELRKSLKLYGLSEEKIDEIINSLVLEQLEETRKVDYDNLQDKASVYAYLKGVEDCNVELEHVEDKEILEYNDEYLGLGNEDNYALIFMHAFNLLDEKSKAIIMNVLVNKEEQSEEYIIAVNRLIEIIYEMDESLAELVKSKMLNPAQKVLLKK